MDLEDTILKGISVDEFHPKTGDSKDVVVVGYRAISKSAAEDLYSFLNSSIYEWRDIEVSPNSDEEGHYFIFVELDRKEDVLETIIKMTGDVENVSGALKWEAKTNLMDNYEPLRSDEFKAVMITDPDNYKTREQFDNEKAEEAMIQQNDNILEFLNKSLLDNVVIEGDVITMTKGKDSAQLRIAEFGDKEIMSDIGISESAIKPLDSVLRQFNSMLGEMRAVPIDDYIVVFHPEQQQVLVTQQCLDS